MGVEYEIKLEQTDRALIDKAFRDHTYFAGHEKTYDSYWFRWDGSNNPRMPNVSVSIKQDRLYICFHGGDNKMFLEFVECIRTLVAERLNQPFVMEEL